MSILTIVLAAAYIAGEGGVELKLFQTTPAKDVREIATPGFTIHPYPAVRALDIDGAKEKSHRYLGLGASMTDAAAWVLANMPEEKRGKLMRELFTPAGCNLGAVRLNIGASDYSTALYSYDDVAGDVEMRHFSLKRDDAHLMPMMRAALAIRPDLYVFAAPWSPPGWMKDSGMMIGGHLKDDCMDALANYLVAYVKACGERGVKVSAVTPQNETVCDTKGQYPCCTYTPEQEAELVTRHVAPAFRKAGLDTKVWIYDHDYKATNRVVRQLSDPETRRAVGGVAWHSYCAEGPELIAPLKEMFPEIPFYHTEQGPHVIDQSRTELWWAKKVFGAFQNGCELFTSWNLCLDELGTPATGAHNCGGFTVVDSETHDVTYSPQYRLFRHIGPFVKRGARVLEVAGDRDEALTILFRNPDGEYVLVVASDGSLVRRTQRRRLVIKYKGLYKTLPLPGAMWSVSTLVFK